LKPSVNNAISYVTPTANVWYYLVGTYNHAYVRFYINGVLANEAPATTNILTATTFRFGNEYNRSYLFTGFMDDVRLYDSAMSASQIKEQYYAGLNSLLASDSINIGEYRERINSIAGK
jgi:hypothetical protein